MILASYVVSFITVALQWSGHCVYGHYSTPLRFLIHSHDGYCKPMTWSLLFPMGKSLPVPHLHSHIHLKTTFSEVWWQRHGVVAFYNSWDREPGQEDSFSEWTMTLREAGAQHRNRLSDLTNHTIDHYKPRHQKTTSKQTILLQTILTRSYRL